MNTFAYDAMLHELQNQLGPETLQWQEEAQMPTLIIDAVIITELLKILRDQFGFNHLANLTAVDYKDELEMVYHLSHIPGARNLAIKCRLAPDNPSIASVSNLYPTADWQEREAYDLMGIEFVGHPNLVRILLPDDFEGHPLRKDFKRKDWQDVITSIKEA